MSRHAICLYFFEICVSTFLGSTFVDPSRACSGSMSTCQIALAIDYWRFVKSFIYMVESWSGPGDFQVAAKAMLAFNTLTVPSLWLFI